MDARVEGSDHTPVGAQAVHQRPGLLRAPGPLGAPEPDAQRRAAGRAEARAPGAAVVGRALHEGLRPGRGRAPAAAADDARLALGPAVRAPDHALLAGR